MTMRARRSGLAQGLGVVGAVWLAGCSSSQPPETPDPEPQGSGSAVLAARAKVLDKAGAAALRSVNVVHHVSELVFASMSPVLDELAAGDVLIVGSTTQTPNGALLKVEDVAAADAGLVVRARAAELGDAFDELHISLSALLNPHESSTTRSLDNSSGLGIEQQALGISFPFSFGSSGKNAISLEGSLALDSSVDLNLNFDFAAFKLKELSLTFEAKDTFTANLLGHGSAELDKTLTLGSIAFSPIIVQIGNLPVVFTPGVTLEANINGSIQGDFATGVTQRAHFTAGVGYHDGTFGGFSDDDSNFDAEPPTYGASASLTAWAGPKLEVLLYGALGPYAGVQGFVEAAASIQAPPVCVVGTVDAGLTATAGIQFLADYSTTLFQKRYPLGSFDSCNQDPKAPRPALTWARTFGRAGSPGETAQAVLQASDGGYFVLGQSDLFDGVTGFAASTWALRLDALGNVIWQKAYQRTDQGLTRAAAELPDGFLVAGTSGVLKLDSGGNLVWSKHYTADDGLEIASIAAQADGSFVLAGTLALAAKAWAMKIDAQGDVVWSHSYAGDHFTHVRTTSDGGAVLSGQIDASDFYVVKLDADGAVAWQRGLDNLFDNSDGGASPSSFASSDDDAYDVIEKPDGNYVLVGESYGNFPIPTPTPVGYYASAVLELDADGALAGEGSRLHRAPSDALYGAAYSVAVRPNGSTIVVGRRADTSTDLLGNEDVLLIQDGTFNVFGGPGNDSVDSGTLAGAGRGMPLQVTSDGGAVLAMTSNSFAGKNQIWLLKLNHTASIDSPYRSSLPGDFYTNESAVSVAVSLPPDDVEVTVEAFTLPVAVETTELTPDPPL